MAGSRRTLLLAAAALTALVGPLGVAPAVRADPQPRPDDARLSLTSTRAVQHRLNALGCDAGPVTGRLGPWTRAALVRFESANHLRQRGRLERATRAGLTAVHPVRCDRRPVPGRAAHRPMRRAVVSQHQNYVWLVAASGRVVAQGPMTDNARVLRPGTYRAGAQCGRAGRITDNTDLSGRFRLHHFVRFAPCGIGFHEIPVSWSTGRLLRSPHLLGTNQLSSHGCVRVSPAMSDRIWRFVRPGTRVVVLR